MDNFLEKYNLVEDCKHLQEWLEYSIEEKFRIPMSEYLIHWAEAKEQFLTKVFDEQIIHTYPVQYNKSKKEIVIGMEEDGELNKVIYDIINEDWYDIAFCIIKNIIDTPTIAISTLAQCASPAGFFWHSERTVLKESVSDKEYEFIVELRELLTRFDELVNIYHLVNNYSPMEIKFQIPGKKQLKIPEKTKTFKALNKFLDYVKPYLPESIYDRTSGRFETLRIMVSQHLNTRKIEGNLCLSIHPLDYATMSDNDCGWRSCMKWDEHSLEGKGEYCAGTLEMMTSPSVVAAYIDSNHPWYPTGEDWTWSNKKWRELFIVDKNFIVGIKGYPYINSDLEEIAFAKLRELMLKNCGIEIEDEIENAHGGMAHWPQGAGSIIFHTKMMYNDLYDNFGISFAKNIDCDQDKNYDFYYGLGAYCLDCGGLRESCDEKDENGSSFRCFKCRGYCLCEHCAEYVPEEDIMTLPDGKCICCICLNDYCPNCYSNLDDSHCIKFMMGGGLYYSHIFICEKCYEKMKEYLDKDDVIVKMPPHTGEFSYIRNQLIDDGADILP